MNPGRLALGALAAMVLSYGNGCAQVPESLRATSRNTPDPHSVVATYLKAVDRGELRVFGHRLDRAMISPKRVDYAFELDSPIPVVRVYSELRQPMAVPNQKDCEVRAVSAILDDAGRIADSEAHIWRREQIKTRC